MKSSTTFVCAGIALLFLAMLYSIAPTLAQFLYSGGRHVPHTPNMFFYPGIFALNYWFCQIIGVGLLLTGVWKLWNEKS